MFGRDWNTAHEAIPLQSISAPLPKREKRKRKEKKTKEKKKDMRNGT